MIICIFTIFKDLLTMVYNDLHPVKIFNFCPKCGSNSFISINDRAKKCEKCSFTFYFNSSAAVAALIYDDKNRLMLTRRAVEPFEGMLDLPGGFIDPLESAEEAILRELKEELGAEVIHIEYLGSFPNEYPFSGIVIFTIDLVFRVKIKSFKKLKPMDDIMAIEFYHPYEIPYKQIPATSISNIIKRYV